MKVGDLVQWIGLDENAEDTDEFYGSEDALGVIVKVVEDPEHDVYCAEVYFADGCMESHILLDLVLINESR
jgi:hypothetical protein